MIDREVEVRRGWRTRQVGPEGRRGSLRARWRAERGVLGRWRGRFGWERAYSPALAAGEERARRREGAGGSGEVELFA